MTTTKTSLRTSTSIPYEIKVLLDSLEASDERPIALAKWARDVFKAGKKHEFSDKQIAGWIEQYALEKDYTDRQIRGVLKQNGYNKQIQDHDFANKRFGGNTSTYNYISNLKHLAQAITELDDDQISKTGLNPSKAADQAMPNIVDIGTQTHEAEREALLHYVQLAIALLQRLESQLRQVGKSSIKLTP